MKFLFNFLLLIPFLGFSQSEITCYEGNNNTVVKIEYWDNGEILSQVHYKDGVRDGSCRYYFKNGVMMAEGFYLKGKMSGYWHSFYENGQLKEKGKYDHRNNGVYSQRTGKWISYTSDGKVFSESTIILGIENIKFYNKDGSIKSTLLDGC
jgi:antitoxin component YwqK of YwqJK toxin-antitoxin module